MRFKWFQGWFDPSTTATDRPLWDLSRFDMGACRGSRGLRAVGSPRRPRYKSAALRRPSL